MFPFDETSTVYRYQLAILSLNNTMGVIDESAVYYHTAAISRCFYSEIRKINNLEIEISD